MAKNKEKNLAKKVEMEQKEAERQAVITKQRRKFDPSYVFSKVPSEKSFTIVKDNDAKTEPPLDEINKINNILETLIDKHQMNDIGNKNLLKTNEVKEDIKREVNSYAHIFNAAKNLVKKVEIANNFLLHMETAKENTLIEAVWIEEGTESSRDDITEDIEMQNSSDDVSENIDVDEVENPQNTKNFDDFYENPTETNEDTGDKNSENDITENTTENIEVQNSSNNISEKFQNMKNLTKTNEEKFFGEKSASTVPQIDKRILRQRSIVDYNELKPKKQKKMKYRCLTCKNQNNAPLIVDTRDKKGMKKHLMRLHGVDKFRIDELFSKTNPKLIELL